jgi:membrane-associated phospholipid phosphatase
MTNNLHKNDFKKKLAMAISNFTHAPLFAIPVFTLINFFYLSYTDFIIITAVCLFFSVILPSMAVFLWARHKNDIPLDIPRKEDRSIPLILAIISYIIGTFILFILNAPPISTVLMFCYFSNTLLVYLINLHWKISIHAMGGAGPTIALIFAFGYKGAILGLIIPAIMWSRVYLKRHTVGQVIAGALVGLIFTAAQMYFFLYYL